MSPLFEKLALDIDNASARKDIHELKKLILNCNKILESNNLEHKSLILFYKANCYRALASIKQEKLEYSWSWKQDEKLQEIFCLRQSILEKDFENQQLLVQCKIYTNLGNSLNQFGRFIPANQYWDLALSIYPNFAMALGNKAHGLIYYAKTLYDRGHSLVLFAHALELYKKALSDKALWDSGLDLNVKNAFIEEYNFVLNYLISIEYDFHQNIKEFPLGNTDKEKAYRLWCLEKNLFLSPLNDVLQESVSAHDIFHLPSHTYQIGEEPRFPRYFNIMKQEYISARYMLFESKNYFEEKHYSDKEVLIRNTFDGGSFSYKLEQMKVAYKMSYSIFDKVALFLNDYFDIGLKVNQVSFRRIWGKSKNHVFEFYPNIKDKRNLSLRGLYYLSKDLFNKDFNDCSLPEAKNLDELRNKLEHRFLTLQTYPAEVNNSNEMSYIEIDEFYKMTLKIMSMAREALIYLSLAMHKEELS